MRFTRCAVLAVVVGMVCPAAASAALSPAVPEGLPAHNATKAGQVVQDRASADPSYGKAVAKNTGSATYDPNDYKVVGYRNGAPADTTNSGVADSGKVSGSQDTKRCNKKSRMLVLLNVQTERKLYICTNCANLRLYSSQPAPFQRFNKGTVAKYKKTATKSFEFRCRPTDQLITFTTKVTVTGKLKARTWGKISGVIQARLQAKFNGKIRIVTTAKCGEVVPATPCECQPPPSGDCNSGDNTNSGTGSAGNCNTCVGVNVCNDNPPPPPPPPPPCIETDTCPPSVTIASWINLNDVPVGKSSGPLPIVVNASHTGSLTVNPDLGGVSLCNSTTKQASVTFNLAAGDNNLCVIYHAPGEASVMEDTITYTAVVMNAGATARDVKTDVFAITHPTRPAVMAGRV